MATDGANNDQQRTVNVLRASQARGDAVYFLFLGVSNGDSRFPFLESIGREFNNTGFISIANLKKFVEMSDDEINDLIISDELKAWMKV